MKQIVSFVLILTMLVTVFLIFPACELDIRPTSWSGKYRYDNARKYTAGAKNFDATSVRNIDIDWGAGTVIVRQDETVTDIDLRETVYCGKTDEAPAVSEDEVLYTWLDGETLRIKYLKSKWGTRKVDAKNLTVLIPAGKTLGTVTIQTDSANAEVSSITADCAQLKSKSGDLASSFSILTELDCDSASGDVSAYGEIGLAKLHSTSGKIYASMEKDIGQLEMESTSGEITLVSYETILPGTTTIQTVSGSVKLMFMTGTAYVIEYRTTSGTYNSTQFENEIQEENRHIAGVDGKNISVETVSGNLTVTRFVKS